MKLYYFPGACSLSCHIALREAGFDPQIEKVDTKTKKTESGADYLAVNPKGYVPTLVTDDGKTLTEATTILQYIADKKPEAKLAPALGTDERYRLQEWLNFIATEIHKGHTPLFRHQTLSDDAKQLFKNDLAARFDYLAKELSGREHLLDGHYTIADVYLFTILGWPRFVGIDLGRWPALQAYAQRIAGRPAVQAAMKAEGLIKG